MYYKSDWQDLAGLILDKESPKKTKQSGRAARMIVQMLDPVLPGERRQPMETEESSEGEDVLPPEGADEDSVEQHDTSPIEPEPPDQAQPSVSRAGRVRTRPAWWENYYVANETLLTADTWDDLQEAIDHGTIDPITFVASNDPDVMYYNQAMKQPDSDKFLQACHDEIDAHHSNAGHRKVVQRANITAATKVVPSVWSMKRKRRIDTREVYKWKARLNIHGGKQEYGVHYWEMYAPVVQWTSIRMCLILSILQNWHTRQLDFVLAYPQADVETEQYMEMPKGFDIGGHSRVSHVLKLIKNFMVAVQGGASQEGPRSHGIPVVYCRSVCFLPSESHLSTFCS
jgi:hypothetical protein